MPTKPPPAVVLDKFLGASTRHIRRVEIYEQDGETRWAGDTVVRLKDGQVTVDYSRDERRALDLTLSNDDGGLINAPGEFWYDKIIKVFRGAYVNQAARTPSILVISDAPGQTQMAQSFRAAMVNNGYGDVQVNTLASTYDVDIEPFDIIVGLTGATASQITLMRDAFRAGKSVLVMDADASAWITATYPSSTATSVAQSDITPISTIPDAVAKGWSTFTPHVTTGTTNVFTYTDSEATVIAFETSTGTAARVSTFSDPDTGGRAVAFSFLMDYQQYEDVNFIGLLTSSISWLDTAQPIVTWETQIGEFMIDRITEPNFPYEVRITGRDYTKKCMGSKYAYATQFTSGMTLESLIGAIAGAAGITKRLLPATGVTVGRDFFFERGVSRWEAMKEIADAYNYEIFFDAQGYLVLREFRDPTTTAPVVYLETGKEGQLASYEKSTTDTRIYNHIVVTGESSDTTIPPVYAEAENTDPASPTNIDELGDRLYQYTSSFITTTSQAQAVADSFLAVHALEEFELNFESLMLPWLEVGDIIGFIDPRPAPGDPTTFLLSTLTIPLGLAPMSGTGRRITNVGV